MTSFVTTFDYSSGSVKFGVNANANERVQILDPERPVPVLNPEYTPSTSQ